MNDQQAQKDGKVKQAGEKEPSRRLGTRLPPELQCQSTQNAVHDARVNQEKHVRQSQVGEPPGNGKQGERITQGDPSSQFGVRNRHHPVSGFRIICSEVPAQGVEVRELPGVENAAQKNGARVNGARDGSPAHNRWYSSNNRTNPSVGNRSPFQRSVDSRVEEDVETSQDGSDGVHKRVEQRHASNPTQSPEKKRMCRTQQMPNKHAVLGPRHLSIKGKLDPLIDRVCRTDAKRGSHSRPRQCRYMSDWRSHRIAAHGGQDDQRGQFGFGEVRVGCQAEGRDALPSHCPLLSVQSERLFSKVCAFCFGQWLTVAGPRLVGGAGVARHLKQGSPRDRNRKS